ncbi:hypothetical protein PInf_004878 [Phytophthora infestans]|nr:hypothetical protein PInf_004878 [Phytophthora infestans]
MSDFFKQIYGHNFERFCFSEYKVVELVDGAENTFDDRDFWREFVKGVLAGFRFVLFTSYGAPVTFLDWGKVDNTDSEEDTSELVDDPDFFPHLSSVEWEALHRLAAASGEAVIQALLTAGSEAQQHLATQEFMARELAELRRRVSTPTPSKNQTDIVKLDASTYSGEGNSRLHLNRWFCEVDISVDARQLFTQLARTRFLLSKLGGKAKEWALGNLVADSACFPTQRWRQ